MAELYTKTKDGQFKKIGDVDNSQANHIKTDINSDTLKNELLQYWTTEKSGKHKNLANKHYTVLKNTLKADPSDYFEQVKSNTFSFGDGELHKIGNLLSLAKLKEYVSPDYIKACFDVSVPRPAIGRGEFLLVASFGNLNFSAKSGDLVDTDGNRIEFKGVRAPLGGGDAFSMMAPKKLISIYSVFDGHKNDYNSLSKEAIDDLTTIALRNTSRVKNLMKQLQNTDEHDDVLARKMADAFLQSHDLATTIAAAHLYKYLKIMRANYLFAINKTDYASFKAPNSYEEAFKLIKNHFSVSGWNEGNTGISITLEK